MNTHIWIHVYLYKTLMPVYKQIKLYLPSCIFHISFLMSWSLFLHCMYYTVSLLLLIVTDCQHRAFTLTVTFCVFELPQEVSFSSDLALPAHVYIKASEPFLLRRCLCGAPALCATSRIRRRTSEKCIARVRRRQETPTPTNQVFYSLLSFSTTV